MNKTGLRAFKRKISELKQVANHLDGDIVHLKFNPQDPQSIEIAIQEYLSAVQKRMAGYGHNEAVVGIAENLKKQGRRAIVERAAAARMKGSIQE